MLGSGQAGREDEQRRYGMHAPPLTLPPIKPQIGAISEHDFTLLPSTAKQSTPGVMAFSDEHGSPLLVLTLVIASMPACIPWASITISIRDTARVHTNSVNCCPVINFLSSAADKIFISD